MDELAGLKRRVADLEAELEASRRTVDALMSRVEAGQAVPPDEQDTMARALAGVQQELARRTRSLEQSEATYRALYESSPDPLLTVDADGVVIACNRTALAWFDLPLEEVIGRPLAERFPPEHAITVDRLCRMSWTGAAERSLALADGRRLCINAAPIDAAPGRFHLTMRDITTRQVLDEVEEQRRRMRALADLASALSRELNDPMSIVQGRLELLLELGETDPAAMQRHLEVALDHARRIAATLRNLRLVGRTTIPALECVFLSEMIEEALDMVGSRVRTVDLRVDLAPPELAAGGDLALYARVFANLLSHAIDISGRGRIEIRGRRRDGEVVVYLFGGSTASGFARLGRSTPGEEVDAAGLGGIGLSLADALVHSLGGRLEARRVGGGILFIVSLPLAPERPVRARPVEARLLVVGREELGRSLSELLDRDGFEVHRVGEAERALSLLDEAPGFTGLATDLFLEGMSGLTLIEEALRRQPALRGRVLLVSDARLPMLPMDVVALSPPLRRTSVLSALGRRVRRRR